MIIIRQNISQSRIFHRKNLYIIIGEVRVLSNVTLTIENGTKIYLMNGKMRSSLIFNTGSILVAKTFSVQACNDKFKPVKKANNGGLWFLGSSTNAEKDDISVKVSPKTSSFTAQHINVLYLGRSDPKSGDDKPNTDDIDGISILGVGCNEWKICEIVSIGSGDDGFDVENSSITLQCLSIINPKEDGLNITSSRVNIIRSLFVKMVKSNVKDRDIFDLETDDGPSYVRMAKGCHVNISGFFGDQLELISLDLPQPKGDSVYYKYDGTSSKGQSYVYSGILQSIEIPPTFLQSAKKKSVDIINSIRKTLNHKFGNYW